MIEYAITNSKGTLLDYGVVDSPSDEFRLIRQCEQNGHDIISQPCAPDCQTGN